MIKKELIIILLIALLLVAGLLVKTEKKGLDSNIMDTNIPESSTSVSQPVTDNPKLGTDKKVYVALKLENDYTDSLEQGCFTRSADSGPGTGQFEGIGYEFAKGSCENMNEKWLEKRGWRVRTLGCSRQLLKSDWCARLKSDHSVKYTLHFLSWTSGSKGPKQRCLGDCEGNDNLTAYIRTVSKPASNGQLSEIHP